MSQLTIVILVGASGSGKTTYANQLLASVRDSYHLSPDECRLELTGDMSDQTRNGFIFNTLVPIRMNGAHARKLNIVFDATNPSKKARKEIIKHAKKLGYRVEAHVFRVPIEVCIARNEARTRVVPTEVIMRQFAQFQEPTLDEGLDAIVEVNDPKRFPIDTLVKLKPLTARSVTSWVRNLEEGKVYKVSAYWYDKIGLEGCSLDDSWDANLFEEVKV